MQSRTVELGPTGPQLVSVPGSVFLRGATVSGYHDQVVRKILRYPEARLKEESWPVTDFAALPALVIDLVETMGSVKGLGLAAIQIGIPLRVFVIHPELSLTNQVFVNPEIVSGNGATFDEEGCLSFPKIRVQIQRKEHVRMKAKDSIGTEFVVDADGLLARALQHEIDHLDGRLLTDYVSSSRCGRIRQQLLRGG